MICYSIFNIFAESLEGEKSHDPTGLCFAIKNVMTRDDRIAKKVTGWWLALKNVMTCDDRTAKKITCLWLALKKVAARNGWRAKNYEPAACAVKNS